METVRILATLLVEIFGFVQEWENSITIHVT